MGANPAYDTFVEEARQAVAEQLAAVQVQQAQAQQLLERGEGLVAFVTPDAPAMDPEATAGG
jgi:hypothetical protein